MGLTFDIPQSLFCPGLNITNVECVVSSVPEYLACYLMECLCPPVKGRNCEPFPYCMVDGIIVITGFVDTILILDNEYIVFTLIS